MKLRVYCYCIHSSISKRYYIKEYLGENSIFVPIDRTWKLYALLRTHNTINCNPSITFFRKLYSWWKQTENVLERYVGIVCIVIITRIVFIEKNNKNNDIFFKNYNENNELMNFAVNDTFIMNICPSQFFMNFEFRLQKYDFNFV